VSCFPLCSGSSSKKRENFAPAFLCFCLLPWTRKGECLQPTPGGVTILTFYSNSGCECIQAIRNERKMLTYREHLRNSHKMIFLKVSLPKCMQCSLHGTLIRDFIFLSKVCNIRRNIQHLVRRETPSVHFNPLHFTVVCSLCPV
jgi:hypothetical protein